MKRNQLKMPNRSCPLVSVTEICWNNKKFLRNCLSSICSQSYPNIDVFLTDKVIKFIKELEQLMLPERGNEVSMNEYSIDLMDRFKYENFIRFLRIPSL